MVAYVAIGYLVWMKLFSIQRYLVAIELCLPLVIYMLAGQMLTYRRALYFSGTVLVICSLIVLIGGAHSWGHDAWSKKTGLNRSAAASGAGEDDSAVDLGDPPLGWMVALFPKDRCIRRYRVCVSAVKAGFDEKVHAIARARGGPLYALIPGYWAHGEYDQARNSASGR